MFYLSAGQISAYYHSFWPINVVKSHKFARTGIIFVAIKCNLFNFNFKFKLNSILIQIVLDIDIQSNNMTTCGIRRLLKIKVTQDCH